MNEHGACVRYLRNKVLNANQFLPMLPGSRARRSPRIQYGATLGGAAVKRSFLFFSWETFACAKGQCSRPRFRRLQNAGEGQAATSIFGSVRLGFYGGICNDKDAQAELSIRSTTRFQSIPAQEFARPFAGNRQSPRIFSIKHPSFVGFVSEFKQHLDKEQLSVKRRTGLGGNSDEYIPRGRFTKSRIKAIIFGRLQLLEAGGSAARSIRYGLCQDRCAETYHTNALAIGYTYTVNPTTTADLKCQCQPFSATSCTGQCRVRCDKGTFSGGVQPAVPA